MAKRLKETLARAASRTKDTDVLYTVRLVRCPQKNEAALSQLAAHTFE